MPKYIPEQHITGELGVNKFHNYCLRHKPHIIFRSEVANNFGMDGEVELAAADILQVCPKDLLIDKSTDGE